MLRTGKCLDKELACSGDLWEVGMNHPAGLASLVYADLYAAHPCYSHLLLLSSPTAFLQSKGFSRLSNDWQGQLIEGHDCPTGQLIGGMIVPEKDCMYLAGIIP